MGHEQENIRREQETRDRLYADGLRSFRIAFNDVSRKPTDERTAARLVVAMAPTREPFAAVDPDASPPTLAVLGDTFAVDSIGFTPNRRGHYNKEKHGPPGAYPLTEMLSNNQHTREPNQDLRDHRQHGEGLGR